MIPPPADPWIERLARLFLEHPAWRQAARRLDPRASSNVFFVHRPGEAWHLERRRGETLLEPKAVPDPDLVFRFTPGAIARLEAVSGDVGDFAAELFERVLTEDPETRIEIRVVAGFGRLVARGYVRLLLTNAARLRPLGAAYQVVGLRSLKRLVDALCTSRPREWEREAPPPGAEDAALGGDALRAVDTNRRRG